MKKRKARRQKPEGRRTVEGPRSSLPAPRRRFPAPCPRRYFAILLASGFWLLASTPAPAQPTQEDVFKSIGDNVNRPVDSTRVAAVLAGIGGAVVLLVVAGQWRRREKRPHGLNHHGRLMKEVLRNLPLRGAEVKQINALAQAARPGGRDERVQSPLTLLLCPSLLAEAAKQSRGKADLPVVAGLVKKLIARA